jgi:CelD/BcsL family acetyltransferase involved in cellulose biosynthesis
MGDSEAAAAPTAQALRFKTYSTLDQLQELRPAWDELLSNYPHASTFSTWEWLDSWWRSRAHGAELLVLALFESSRLVGLAPLSISNRNFLKFLSLHAVQLMGDGSGDSDNLDFPALPGFEMQLAQTILDYLEHHRQQWDICEFNTMPSGSPVAGCLEKLLRSRRWTCFEYSRTCSAVHLPRTWDEYLEQLSSEDRNNLARYGRRLNKRFSAPIYRCTDEQQLPRCLEALFQLHQARWEKAGEPGSFGSAERREFYAQLSRRLLARGWLELWVLELNGAIAAVQFAFRYGNTVYQLQEGYDPEHASDRAGFVLRGEVLKQLISDGVRVYDFLGGELSYKRRWGAQAGQYRDLHFAPKMAFGATYLRSVVYAGRAKQWLRLKLPRSVWRVLHFLNVPLKGRRER